MRLNYFLTEFLFPNKFKVEKHPKDSDIIDATISLMRDSLDKKLSVEEMAATQNLSASHFSMLFRKATGMPPIDYFIHLKMQKACQLIYASNSKVKDIALSLGYDDPYYFSRVFRKNMGVAPEHYRLSSKGIG